MVLAASVGDEFAQFHIVPVTVASRDMQNIDAHCCPAAAVESCLHQRPITITGNAVRLGAANMIIEADLAAHSVRFHPTREFVLRVGLERRIGVKACVGIAACDATHRARAAVRVAGAGHDGPFRSGVRWAIAIVAALPAVGQPVGAGLRSQTSSSFKSAGTCVRSIAPLTLNGC